VLSKCPQCHAHLAILRVIAGKAGAEYWTMRCTRCGGISYGYRQALRGLCSS
jgi:ssDNA-binding Zn-finger/Zn-ribbon topoisomerase 1